MGVLYGVFQTANWKMDPFLHPMKSGPYPIGCLLMETFSVGCEPMLNIMSLCAKLLMSHPL